jgi:hypothetical protein
MSRNYRKEYDNYHSKPEQKIRRAARNAARSRFKDADPNKDVHHKDNNPLNNDRNNLSLVTQHYNRREPRLRKEEDFQEGPLVVANEFKALEIVAQKFHDILRKKDLKSQQKLAAQVGIKLSKRGKKFQIEGVDGDAMINLMQKYLNTKNKNEKKVLLKQINRYQKKLGLKVTEDMGTVTGPHIAGTGDDSSTVKVRKKKKVRRRKEEGLKHRMSPNMTDWEKRNQLSRQVRNKFWKSLKGKKKKDVNLKFKLKNSKSLKKRIIDNVLAIQQKI